MGGASLHCSLMTSLDGLTNGGGTGNQARNETEQTSPSPSAKPDETTKPQACTGSELFCDDFEHADLTQGGWTNVRGDARISTAQALSGTRSLQADIERNGEWPSVTKRFPSPPHRLVLSFGIFGGAAPRAGYEVAKVAFGAPNNWDLVSIAVNEVGLVASTSLFDDSPTPTKLDEVVALPSKDFYGTGWHRVVVHVDLDARPKKVTVRVDSRPSQPMTLPSSTTVLAPLEMQFGLTWTSSSNAFSGLFFDDVVLAPE